MATFKPTLKEPTPMGKNYDKKFTQTMNAKQVVLKEDIDGLLTEREQSLKKKIFSLAKMEALVFSDPTLKAKYEEMAENGEEKYGYHYNETIQNMLFNDYVLNSPKYLQKYKMAIPKEKKRRDKSGINQLKKSGEQAMQHKTEIKKPAEPTQAVAQPAMPKMAAESTGAASSGAFVPALDQEKKVEETTSTAGGGAGPYYTKYAWGKGDLLKGKSGKQANKPQIAGGTIIQESNYLLESDGFEKYIQALDLDGFGDNQQNDDETFLVDRGNENTQEPTVTQVQNKPPVGVWDKIKVSDKKGTPAVKPEVQFIDQSTDTYGNLDNMSIENLDIIKQDLENKQLDNPNFQSMEESKQLQEKAVSKAQQKFMGMVHAVQKGELSPDKVGDDVAKAADSMKEKDAEDFASTKHKGLPEKKISETDQSIIGDTQQTMKNTEKPAGTISTGNVPTGAQQTGGSAMNEDYALLEELNKELEAFSIHHNKLMRMAEDKKPSSLIMKDRLGDENKANFKKDLQHSGTKEIIDTEKELQWKDQQTDVNDPMKLGQDIEKKAVDALNNVGDSTNEKGTEIPKRNMTPEEQEQVELYRKGQQSLVYDSQPSKRFEERMAKDMGDKMMDIRKKQLDDLGQQPMYNKDSQPTNDGIEKKQFDKEKEGWNDPEGLNESMITGRYFDALNKRRIIDFTLNEVALVENAENLFELDFTGLGNSYVGKTQNKKVLVNETVTKALDSHKFFTDGSKIFAVKNPAQNLNENEIKGSKAVINEQVDKMKHLLGYKPSDFVSTKGTKEKRGF